MFDVAVIGAGVVGGMIARTLMKYQLRVCVIDRANDVATGASAANSAIVHAGFDAHEGSLKAKLNVRGSEMMEEVCRELGVKYKNNGSLVVGFTEEDRKTLEELLERGKTNGVKGLRILNQEEVRALEPNIGDGVICALHAPTGSIVCPYELTIASIGNAMDNGAELFLNYAVEKIEKAGDAYEISAAGKEKIVARYVINAAGISSDEIAKAVGDESISVHPRRGEYILLDKESGNLVSHTIFRCPSKMGKGILVSPTVDGNLLTGPTSVDMEDKTDKSTTQEGLARVMKEASENVKGIRFGQSITSFCGLRSVGNTGDFIINHSKPHFINVAGIESPGLSSSPAIAEYVVELLEKDGLETKPNPKYVGTRKAAHAFREASVEEKNAIIKQNPAFGHIICRCETVTEGEILEAIRTNPKPRDLDGIKRRTRAQMGRCQGGFCSPLVVEMLAKEMGVSVTDVTKFGGNSYINEKKTKGEH